MEKLKQALNLNLSTVTAPKICWLNPLLCSFSLQFIFFSRTAVLQKLFDIGFSYKHCNYSRVCILVKMASKTVTKSFVSSSLPTKLLERFYTVYAEFMLIQSSVKTTPWLNIKNHTSKMVSSSFSNCYSSFFLLFYRTD